MWQNNCYMWYWNHTIRGWNRQMWEKKKVRKPPNVKKKKKTVTCDVGTVKYEDEIIKCEKK